MGEFPQFLPANGMLCPDVKSFEVLGGVARSKSNL